MSRGVLIYARNTAFDYARLAKLNLSLIQNNLRLPVAVVTDNETANGSDLTGFDYVIVDNTADINKRIFDLGHKKLPTRWANGSRISAYEASPFSQTLLVDADYLMFGNQTLGLFEVNPDFAVFDRVFDITTRNRFSGLRLIGPYAIPMRWATVIYFSRNEFAQAVFSMISKIKHNYEYYSHLYHFPRQPYRNDFALSIALHALSGQTTDTKEYLIPWRCMTLSTKDKIIGYNQDQSIEYQYEVMEHQATKYETGRISGCDLHLMDKISILDFYDQIIDSHRRV